jgi:hypothetical protein
MTTAARLRRFRGRQANGLAVLHVEINLLDLTGLLVAAGLLKRWDDSNRAKVEQATQQLLKILIEEGETRFWPSSSGSL